MSPVNGIPPLPGGHEHMPADGSVYCEGPLNAGLPGDVRNPAHYPLRALCSCGRVIRCERPEQFGWADAGGAAGPA